MVVFVTLFLALTSGVQPVAVEVEEPVVRVELALDGQRVAELTKPPWESEVDFGPLQPHRLEAVGYDARGRERDRAVLLLNLPRARAESRILLELGPKGLPRQARLVWDTVEKLDLERVELRFDGRPLPVEDPEGSIPLPAYEAAHQHHLVVELVFEGGLRSEAAVGLGGIYGAEVSTELTAVTVRRRSEEPLPSPADMKDWFLHRGKPVPVRVVEPPDPEKGGADFFVVRNALALIELRNAARPRTGAWVGMPALVGGKGDELRARDRGFLVHAVPADEASRNAAKSLFPISPALSHRGRGGLTWLLASVRFRNTEPGSEQLAEAAAVAGLTAARGRPRAVVAFIHPDSPDDSPSTWSEVRRYLTTLRVPLYLWSPVSRQRLREEWGEAEPIRWPVQFRQAVQRLRQDIDSQVVVWLEGIFLPQEIELSEAARKQVEWVR